MIKEALSIPYDDAAKLLREFGSVRNAINAYTNK